MGIIIAILVFGLLITFHEFGHFILARINGIKVNDFSIGFGPRLFKIHGKKTDFCLRLIPLGGSCSMEGEDEESEDPESFNNKSVLRRISVVLAGPVFNFILAFVFAVILIANTGAMLPTIGSVVEGSPAEMSGLKAGDEIERIDGKKVNIFKDITSYRALNPKDEYELTIRRGDQELVLNVPTAEDEDGSRYMGFTSDGYTREGVAGTIKYAYYETKYNVDIVFKSLGMLLTGKAGIDDLSGPVGMVSMIGESVNESKDYGAKSVFLTICLWIVLLSANLGVMNLLPIPALDGGRILFLIVEGIRGKPFNRNVEGMINFVFFILLIALMLFIMSRDIIRLF